MMKHVLRNVNNGTLMDDNEKNSRAAKILMSLLPPHAMIVLTAMSTLEIIIAKRKKRMADLVDSMDCLLYTSPSPRDVEESRMPSSA